MQKYSNKEPQLTENSIQLRDKEGCVIDEQERVANRFNGFFTKIGQNPGYKLSVSQLSYLNFGIL